MSRDQLLIARPSSKGPVAGAEASSTNQLCVPPGLYDVEITHGPASAGGLACTASIQEAGYAFNDLTHTKLPFQNLLDARSRALSASTTLTERFFLRGVRITLWNDGAPNAGVAFSAPGAGNYPQVQATFWPIGRAIGFNGQP